MSLNSRIQKAFARQGVAVSYGDGAYRLARPDAEARILLPAHFPLEAKAVDQLLNFAAVRAPGSSACVCQTCATPDFHPGSLAPVGAVVATSPDMVIPQAIGTDINCGMRLLSTGLPAAQALPHLPRLERQLTHLFLHGNRDVPLASAGFRALFSQSPETVFEHLGTAGLWAEATPDQLRREAQTVIGLAELGGGLAHAPEALIGSREVVRDPALGTVGSGNHFVEIQVVDSLYDRRAAYALRLKEGDLSVMIHSGSRDIGFYVGQRWMDRARDAWPKGLAHPPSGLYALTDGQAAAYLDAMGVAARWAWFNRVVLGEMVRKAFRDSLATDQLHTLVDVPHNVILREGGFNIHRKGATPARAGDLALIPGSMGDYSYLVRGLGNPEWLASCSHGAGRLVRRQVSRLSKPEATASGLPWRCLTLRESRRLEEAPSAYKPVGPVIDTQVEHGLIQPIARFRPWLTVKA